MKSFISALFISTSIILFPVTTSAQSANNESIVLVKSKATDITPDEQKIVDILLEELNKKKTMQGEFFQSDARTDRQKGAYGKFYYQKPGLISFVYTPPNDMKITSDGKSVLVDSKRARTLDLYPVKKTPMRFLLGDIRSLSKDGLIRRVKIEKNKIKLLLEQNSWGARQMTLEFDKKTLELVGWIVHEEKSDIGVELYNVVYDKAVDKSLFKIDYGRVHDRNTTDR